MSFWRRLKTDLLGGSRFPGLNETLLGPAHNIANYNGERHHYALGH